MLGVGEGGLGPIGTTGVHGKATPLPGRFPPPRAHRPSRATPLPLAMTPAPLPPLSSPSHPKDKAFYPLSQAGAGWGGHGLTLCPAPDSGF